ncbi:MULTISPECIES: CPBP family intramembrane glutamic endopeptidase [unclassified Moorena]|uniref:CPBP family intramembrane glutamic endopeptidase n=1 Tax=unclassified Moorena TaxID=2683338 RepID=UPI0013CD9FEA|nr:MULTISPECIES: CPBP family intramembrane glutamic endopeptidase [unclassified Moorena]NEO22432.1 CPBP family intramembrane metalloprotease [Moorena sp. SIO4A5]NEQ59339.1 CPBP family intramembrane metalloprotease [Moorena sp. SIO4A1]
MTIKNTNSKNHSINLILCGLAFQFIPLLTLGLISQKNERFLASLYPPLSLLIILLILGLLLYGYVPLVKGCRLYIHDKGYPSNWGWLGLLSIWGLSVLFLFPTKRNKLYSEESLAKDSINHPFNKLNIPEFLLFWFLGFPIYILTIVGLFGLVNNRDFSELIENADFNAVIGVIVSLFIGLFLFLEIRRVGFDLRKFGIFNLGILKHQKNLKLIIFIVIIEYAFAWGFYSLNLYYISFIFPDYVEKFINESCFTNVIGLIFCSFSAIVCAPLLEELICRGIILQKWAMKWGIKAGIFTSSLLFAIFHLRFDIVGLFIAGTIFCVLYFKTGKLIVPILCHSLYNTIVTIFRIRHYYSSSNVDFISVNDYRASMEPLLGQKAIVAAISFAVIMVFLYRNFPKQDDILPYYRNPK